MMMVLFPSLILTLVSGFTFSQQLPPPADARTPQQLTLHSSSNLVLSGVIAESTNGVADTTLEHDDFVVFDNSHRVSVKTFDICEQSTARPLTLWFVMQCKMKGWDLQGFWCLCRASRGVWIRDSRAVDPAHGLSPIHLHLPCYGTTVREILLDATSPRLT
jgi:hypothetical protein